MSANDYQRAIDVQDACNLSGVVHSFADVMSKLCTEGLNTDARNRHPIAVLYSSKIASLTGSESGPELAAAIGECERLAAV